MSVTVVFPDSSLPESNNGGFANQDEFRKFVTEKQKNGQWTSALHARPMAERLADYKDGSIAMAFPLQFPFGHTGLPEDPALKKLAKQKKWKGHLQRNRENVMRAWLGLRKPDFHTAFFNLIIQSTLMKASVFHSTKVYCNVKCADGEAMSQK